MRYQIPSLIYRDRTNIESEKGREEREEQRDRKKKRGVRGEGEARRGRGCIISREAKPTRSRVIGSKGSDFIYAAP